MLSHPSIASALAAERERALREEARRSRRSRGAIPIRNARPVGDAAAILRARAKRIIWAAR